MSKTCYKYIIKFNDYFFPSLDIFYPLCFSYDKTRLFIVSFIRIFIYIFLFDYIQNVTFENKNTKEIIIYILNIVILINMIYLFIVMLKTPIKKKYLYVN